MNRLIAVVGPTAVGKTKASIDLAIRLETEIISGDSMLVYQGMNIGTAKPCPVEQSGVIHHLIDILDPAADYSVVDFQAQASNLVHDINRKGKIPILAGGTGLYVKALLEGYQFATAPGSDELRRSLAQLADEHGPEHIYRQLQEGDPQTAARLHPNDLRRVIRALEVCLSTGETVSQRCAASDKGLIYDTAVIGLTMERSLLYKRINERVDTMFANGLVEEVTSLLAKGVPTTSQSMQGIGYKEVVLYLKGETDLPTTVEKIKQATRNFAKRQLTWYRKMPYIQWFDAALPYDILMETIYSHIARNFHLR